jgi:hypothetical protein
LGYRDFRWVRQWPRQREPIVWINIAKLDASWRNDVGYYLGQDRGASADRWIKKHPRLRMPHVGLDRGIVSFTDGRHRFAWMRDNGAYALPVSCNKEVAAEIKRRFGSRSRRTRIRE